MFLCFQGTQFFKPLTFTVFGVIALICGGLVWLLPETKGNPLQDQLLVVKPPESADRGVLDIAPSNEEEAIPLNDMHVDLENGALSPEKT